MTARKMAVIRLSPAAIRDLLQLPPETEVVRVEMERGMDGVVEVVLRGVGALIEEGAPLPPASKGIVNREVLPDGRELKWVIDWGFPK